MAEETEAQKVLTGTLALHSDSGSPSMLLWAARDDGPHQYLAVPVLGFVGVT